MKSHRSTLIETVRIHRGVAPLWGFHLRRLAGSCVALGIPLPTTLLTPEGGADRIHRLEVDSRGVRASERLVPGHGAVRLITARSVVHRPYPHKTTDRAQFDDAATEARAAAADDAVLLTPGGLVAETTVCGIFWWEGERLAAPALDIGVLPGVSRMRLNELVGGIVERRLPASALGGHAMFLANAARGIIEVTELDGLPVPQSQGTRVLAARFWG